MDNLISEEKVKALSKQIMCTFEGEDMQELILALTTAGTVLAELFYEKAKEEGVQEDGRKFIWQIMQTVVKEYYRLVPPPEKYDPKKYLS